MITFRSQTENLNIRNKYEISTNPNAEKPKALSRTEVLFGVVNFSSFAIVSGFEVRI
jgi:hypothetical protein